MRWSDSNKAVVQKARDLEIDVLELLMSLAAVHMIKPWLKNKTVTLYNDNPGATAALRTKAPPLNRMDLQCLVLELASLAYEQKFYW